MVPATEPDRNVQTLIVQPGAVGGAKILDPELAAAPEDARVDRGRKGVVVERDRTTRRTADGDFVAQLEDTPTPLGWVDDAQAQDERPVASDRS
jgi:hypothetical protein